MAAMNQRIEQKSETRGRILESAEQAIRRDGLQGPTVASVMAGAGLTVGGFYAHFDSKDAMLLESLHAMLERQMRQWLDTLPQDVDGATRRQRAARGYLSRKHRDQFDERCPLPRMLGQLPGIDASYAKLIAEHIDDWARALADPRDAEERRKSLAAIATMVGAFAMARAFGPTDFSDEILTAAKSAIR